MDYFCYRFLIILPISELGKLNAFFCKMQMTSPEHNIKLLKYLLDNTV